MTFAIIIKFEHLQGIKAETMDISRFTAKSMGKLVPFNGTSIRGDAKYEHFAFIPSKLPSEIALSTQTHTLIAKASLEVGRLQESIRQLSRPAVLLKPSLAREAKSTSALEGTFAPLQEIFESEFIPAIQTSAAVREIQNYVRAAQRGLEHIKTKPITINIISELQGILVDGTKGGAINQGKIRTGPVIIGDAYKPVSEARFIPPPAGQDLEVGFSDWEKWINSEFEMSPIIKIALGHYQFETLHPYADGNGRVGRLVISLQLVDLLFLDPPVLNLSEWLNENSDEYRDGLLSLSQDGNFDRWLNFFCRAVTEQAALEIERIRKLLAFRDALKSNLIMAKQRGVVLEIPELLLSYPVVSINQIALETGVTYPPARSAVYKLVEMGILREVTGRKNNKLFISTEVISILDS